MTESDTNPLGHIGVPRQFTARATRYETSPRSDIWPRLGPFPTKLLYFPDQPVTLPKGRQPIRRKANVITSDSKNSKSSSAHIGSDIASYIGQSSDKEKAFHRSDNRQVLLPSSSHISITDGPSPIVFGSVPVEAINTPASAYHPLLSCLLIYMKVNRPQPISSQTCLSQLLFSLSPCSWSQWKCTHYLFQYNPALNYKYLLNTL